MADNGIGNINPAVTQALKDIAQPQPSKSAQQTQPVNREDNSVKTDRIEISRQAKTISKAIVYLNQMQDIREELVQKAIKERLVDNSRVPAQILAAKLLLED